MKTKLSRGYLKDLDQPNEGDVEKEEPDFHIRAEINIDPEEGSIIETAIARNSATAVKSISQAGARGILQELAKTFAAKTGKAITTSETDENPDAVDTKHLLQLCRLVMPKELAPSQSETEILKPYKNKEKCLQEFADGIGTVTNWLTLARDTISPFKSRPSFGRNSRG